MPKAASTFVKMKGDMQGSVPQDRYRRSVNPEDSIPSAGASSGVMEGESRNIGVRTFQQDGGKATDDEADYSSENIVSTGVGINPR